MAIDYISFTTGFISKNFDKILSIGKSVYKTVDENIKLNLESTYNEYLNTTERKYSTSKSFFIRNQTVNLYNYYTPVGIGCDRNVIEKPSYNNCIGFSKRLVISGTGGCGKSVLIRHLFLDCIRNGDHAPILIELRELNGDTSTLESIIETTLQKFGFSLSTEYISKAKKSGHFCFLLDGYDEVNYSRRDKLIKEIKTLSDKFTSCPIIISTRPDEVFNGIDGFNIFKMLPLSIDSAADLVKKLPYDDEVKIKFISVLKDGVYEKHSSFLSNPLLLSIMLLTYGENAEIPEKQSLFYSQAYEALFQRHDANKGGYNRQRLSGLDVQDFSRIFSLFSLLTYDKRIFKMPRMECLDFIDKSSKTLGKTFRPEDYLQDLLSAACLMLEDGLDIAYSHRSFQEYFVALHISNSAPDLQKLFLDRYWKNISSDNVIILLLEINPDLVERALFIPILDGLFNEIGVKKSVGITHASKYLKTLYDSLILDVNGITARSKNRKGIRSSVIHIANNHFNPYILPDEDYRNKFFAEMNEKHGVAPPQDDSGDSYETEDQEIEYHLNDLSYKSPFLNDLLNSDYWLSTKFIQHCYETLKKLKFKHENQTKSIEDLLGLKS